MKLYRSTTYPTRWYAYATETGWVMFPKEIGGWKMRQPARGIDPIDVREVPLHLALTTGFPGTPALPVDANSDHDLCEAA